MQRKIVTLCLIILLTLSCSVTVFAQGLDAGRTGSITVTLTEPKEKLPIAGAEFEVYYAATVGINTDKNLNYIYTRAFKDCGFPLDDPQLPTKLSAYVVNSGIVPQKIVTDETGKAVCTGLPLGLYLVKQTGAVDGFSLCSPFLVTVPIQDGDTFIYDVDAAPKTDAVRLVSITIKKTWNTGKASAAAESVTVQLLRGEEVVQTATLDRTNNWQITYPDMPESDDYSIVEVNVPQGFTATYTKKDFEFTVTNTSSLAQTGQLIWPIPVLAAAGLFFLTAGFMILRKPEETDA